MMKYLVALLVALLAVGGVVYAQPAVTATECTDCYANIITQTDTQSVDGVRMGLGTDLQTTVAIGNEGLSAAIIVTQAPAPETTKDSNLLFVHAPFARIDQVMKQTVSNIGPSDPAVGEGAKGITWNKAIQAAWIANQGVKEWDPLQNKYVKEGSYISQSTTQTINNVYDFQYREGAKVLNVDNKLAMIVHDVKAVIDLTAGANSSASDTQSSTGEITNAVNITIAGKDP